MKEKIFTSSRCERTQKHTKRFMHTDMQVQQDQSTTRTTARQTIWSCCGPKFSGPQHDHTIWSWCGPEISGPQHDVGKYYGRALVLRHRVNLLSRTDRRPLC